MIKETSLFRRGALIALILLWSAGGAVGGFARQAGPGVPLRLESGTFDPLYDLPAGDAAGAEESGRLPSVRIVQFRSVPDRAVRAAVEGSGARVLGYLPEAAYVVRLEDGDTAARLRALPGYRWDGAVEPVWKLAPDLGARTFREAWRRAGGRMLVTVDLWSDADAEAVGERLSSLGLELRAVWTDHGLRRLLARGTRTQIESAAALEDVAWIEEHPEATLRNDAATWVVQSNVENFRPIWDKGLHGEGQIVGNIDGRLDMGSCYFDDGGAPPGPSHRKVVAYRSNNGQGADSHGTHTNGTMAGDSGVRGVWDPGDGHAFAAKISFSNLGDVSGSGTNPSNLLDRLADAHSDGARVHGNSWGDDGTTSYTTWSRDIDDFSWQFEDSLVMFAITNGSALRTPENAKNVLAVGATQREANADNHCSGGVGPTSDGRRKPEIYAPGCSTVSAASGQACGTRGLTGTSMACPAVTGAAALVRQYFEEGWYPSGQPFAADSLVPSGALVKAVLISGAEDMTGIAGYPSDLEGWGRVHLDRSLFFSGDSRGLVVLDDVRRAGGLEAGQAASYGLTVDSSAEPLRITLVFTEPPAELMASAATINNLDLKVETPDGTVYRGNLTDGNGESVPGGAADGINNLEQVLFTNPVTGTYNITIEAASVPVGPQGYALLATGGVVPAAGPRIRYTDHRIIDPSPLGNDNVQLDQGETVTVPVTLANPGNEGATGVRAELIADRADWVRITGRRADWPDLDSETSAESIDPHFELIVSPDAPCGERVQISVVANSDQTTDELSKFPLDIGDPNRDYAGPPLDIPQQFLQSISSALDVTDDVVVREIDVSVDISHGDVSELFVMLVSPSLSQVVLHNRTRPGEQDLVARYDLEREPDGPGSLGDFIGQPALGTWSLEINDNRGSTIPAGRLNGWTLHLKADRALTCDPLACGDEVPGVTDGLLLEKAGDDVRFSWQPTVDADGYHLLESASVPFGDPLLTGRTAGETELTEAGGAVAGPPGLTAYQVRAVNGCGWEGP